MNNDDRDFDKDSFEKNQESYTNPSSNPNMNSKTYSSSNRSTGIVLIVVGVLWLVSKFTDFNIFNFSALSQLWPLIFVVAGVNILFKHKKYIGNMTWLAFFLVIIFFSNADLKAVDTGIPQLDDIQSKVIEKVNSKSNIKFEYGGDMAFNNDNYKNFIKANRLESDMLVAAKSKDSKDYFKLSDIDMGKGNLLVNLNTASLNIKGSNQNKLESTYDYVDVFEKIDSQFGFYVITKEKYQNVEKKSNKDIEIELFDEMEWNIEVNAGAISGKIDLSELNLNNVEINSGASSYEIDLPNDDLNLEFNGGASSVEFEVPKELGVHLEVNGMLVSKSIDEDDFYIEDGDYYSNNYKEAKHKANIEVNIATGDVDIKIK